jgi:predicted acyl esterase
VWSPQGSPCGAPVDQWAIGPLLSAQSIGGFPNLPCLQDDRPTQVGPSILNYTTAPMSAPVTLGGPIAATIYATATSADTQWVAEIEDVAPDGTARPLTEGALLGSLRATDAARTWSAPDGLPLLPYHPYTRASAQAVTPGAVTRYDVEIFPTLATIAAGHRIRLTLSTADAPHLSPSVPETANLVGGVYQVQHTQQGPSSIELPLGPVVVPAVNAAAAVKHPTKKRVSAGQATRPPSGSLAATGFGAGAAVVAVALLTAAAVLRRRTARS